MKFINIFFVAVLMGCTTSASPGRGSGSSDDANAVVIRFNDTAMAAGVADLGVNTTGPSFLDFDSDGDMDIYVTTETHQIGQGNRLWRNDGKDGFTNVAEALGIADEPGLARGAAWADIDNDGDMDLAISNMPPTRSREKRPMSVYKNMFVETGKQGFVEITLEAGFVRVGNEDDLKNGGMVATGGGVGWADYNNDGLVDLYWKVADYEVDNELFRNNGDGTFTQVTEASGTNVLGRVQEANAQGSPSWTDLDQDGNIDLLATIEGARNVLFYNKGDGTFKDITRTRKKPSGLAFLNPGNANGACIGDLDNDGDMDIYLPTADQANRLLMSQLAQTGEVDFDDATLTSGTGDLGGARGCVMADFDNDGLLDIYVNNGGPSNVLINDVISQMPVFVQFYIAWEPAYNVLYHNNGDGTFKDVTLGSGSEGLGIGSGVGAADLNNDGFADIFVANRTYYNMGEAIGPLNQNQLLTNAANDNNWVRVAVTGTASHRDAYGARVSVISGDLVQVREKSSAHGYNSASDPRLLFGLGDRDTIDRIEVIWPGGQLQTVENPEPGQTILIVQE